ncbi:unnamed protein product [Adineta ricciae]|uniref:G-protein coupled receptors family 1 profile domain-containing protein n=2 Tax=Adineta ricciae TaxID=249248 RepID=A0A815VXD3_ADIRI|nr:unnamed protein product [Adineta ricciae]
MSTTTLVPRIPLNPNIITNYFGSFLLIFGVIGESLNIFVFLSLRTFRESSCAFYLTLSSAIKIIQLLTGLLSRVVTSITADDWTAISPFFCKFRSYLLEFCPLSDLSLACLAVIDQFFATSNHRQWQQWCNIKIATRLSLIVILFSLIISIPQSIFFETIKLSATNRSACIVNNKIFDYYNQNINLTTLFGPLPVLITIVFALLTYRHVKQIAYRTIPLVRRRLDQQLTTMVLTQSVFNSIVIAQYIILVVLVTNTTLLSNPSTSNQTQFALTTTSCIYYLYTASSFYIYICTSERFRHQLHYVLFDIHLNRWRARQIHPINNIVEVIL